MPEEILSEEEFLSYLPLALNVFVKRVKGKEIVKLKLRTKRKLFTYKTTPKEAERLLNSINVPYEQI